MPAAEMLRKEILGFQNAQAQLLRWKLIAIGATAAAAFGIATDDQPSRLLVLAIVPLIAVYCDLLSRDYDIRIALIAAFLWRQGGEYASYENFLRAPGVILAGPWFLGNAATFMSSVMVCILVIWIGFQPQIIAGAHADTGRLNTLVVAGVAGILVAILIEWHFSQAYRRIAVASLTLDAPANTTLQPTPKSGAAERER